MKLLIKDIVIIELAMLTAEFIIKKHDVKDKSDEEVIPHGKKT